MERLIENGVACSIYSEVDDPAGAREHDRIHADSERIKGGSHGYPLFRMWYTALITRELFTSLNDILYYTVK